MKTDTSMTAVHQVGKGRRLQEEDISKKIKGSLLLSSLKVVLVIGTYKIK